jgi:8-oxo-dGTP pyrophosphatase MutT (NUDIX family)
MNSIKKTTFCNNCGKIGHLFHQCKIPITSIGILAFRKVNINDIEILLVKRKDSLAFVDFMRGKYNLDDIEYIINLFEKMTVNERNSIKNKDFVDLWNYLWGDKVANQYKNEEKVSKFKFFKLKEGYQIMDLKVTIEYLIEKCKTNYNDPEWGFPKGRRNYQEKDIMCAIREFEEETGYNKNDITLLNNIIPLEEIFTGSNYKSYKHKYFLGYMNNNIIPENIFQVYEISKIEWVNIDNAISYIRDYNIEKKNILIQLKKLLKTYKLYI